MYLKTRLLSHQVAHHPLAPDAITLRGNTECYSCYLAPADFIADGDDDNANGTARTPFHFLSQ